MNWALAGGEDYELLFTAPPESFDEAVKRLVDHGTQACRLGAMRPAAEGSILVKDSGERVDLEGVGYDHFA